MRLDEAKKILKDAGFLVENIDDVSSREDLIEMILEDPYRDENITLEILKTWSFEELEKYHEECEERYLDDVYGKDRDGIDEAKELLENNGYICENVDDVINFIYTGAAIIFSPLLRAVAVITDGFEITYGFENELDETLERAEYSIFKKIINNKFLKLMFKKLISNDNLKEKLKNKLLDTLHKKYGYIDELDEVAKMREEMLIKCYNSILNKLENKKLVERYDLDYDSVNSSFDEEKRLEKFGEYLYEVRELLVRKGFSRGKQADNYDELHDIAHRCCRLGKSIEDCAKEIILTIK